MKSLHWTTNPQTTKHLCGFIATLFLMAGCQSLPPTPHLTKSIELTKHVQQKHHTSTTLSLATPPTGLSGYYLVGTGADAFAARSVLADMAHSSIDVQYYIWHDDEAGLLMLKTLWQAAERGVKVRLLLDDFNSSPSLDQQLLKFAKHPNIAVRLINPFSHRRFKSLSYLTEPTRINIRMHNKSMTFDNHASIIGGRNIGNEYLNNDKNNTFADLDVLVIGEVVKDIKQSFEHYWQSSLSYDIQALYQQHTLPINNQANTDIDSILSASKDQKALQTYEDATKNSTISHQLLQKTLTWRWAAMEFLADDVKKLSQSAPYHNHLVEQLRQKLGRPSKRLSIISSYFVPTKDGVKTLVTLAKSGVRISILTNSFDATDVGAVHAGYGHWRKELLKAGIRLYELKSTATNTVTDENKLWRTKQTTTTSLHAKAFAVDDHQVFIGSYNIDPRSANINTELGVLIQDSTLATQLHQALNNTQKNPSKNAPILNQAYEVLLDANDKLIWRTFEQGKEVIYQQEPDMNIPEKTGVFLLSILPIDGLL